MPSSSTGPMASTLELTISGPSAAATVVGTASPITAITNTTNNEAWIDDLSPGLAPVRCPPCGAGVSPAQGR